MKTYEKQQFTGNENGWDEPIKVLGETTIPESMADELNSHFRNTGIKYVIKEAVEEKKKPETIIIPPAE